MEVLHPRCAGPDVHKDTVVACVRSVGDGGARAEVRTFDAVTPGLLALSDRLAELTGKSGRAILEALIEGERDPDALLAPVRPGVEVRWTRLFGSPAVRVDHVAIRTRHRSRSKPAWQRLERRGGHPESDEEAPATPARLRAPPLESVRRRDVLPPLRLDPPRIGTTRPCPRSSV